MEARPRRGRGGSWKRGGRGGDDGDGFGGEHRSRGRGGHYGGRDKRDHHRGRGRGGGARAAEFRPRDQDGGETVQEEDGVMEVFPRRKLESNWDRYKDSEEPEPDHDVPTQRGTDYHVLLQSAGDSFAQFRFSEEKDWDMDSFTSQVSPVFVDLQALAQNLLEVPLHQRLNLEAELVQVATPAELPPLTLVPKQEIPKTPTAPSAKSTGLCTSRRVTTGNAASESNRTEPPADGDADDEEELDQLLRLQKPVSRGFENPSVADVVPQKVCEEPEVIPEEKHEVKEVPPPTSAAAKQEMTEEDLEDWLDSMIS